MKEQVTKELHLMLNLKQTIQNNVASYPFVSLEGLDIYIGMLEDSLRGYFNGDNISKMQECSNFDGNLSTPKKQAISFAGETKKTVAKKPDPRVEPNTYYGLKCEMYKKPIDGSVVEGDYSERMGEEKEFRKDRVEASVRKSREVFKKHKDVITAHEKMFFHVSNRILWCKHITNVGIKDDMLVVEFILVDTLDYKKMQSVVKDYFTEFEYQDFYAKNSYVIVLRKENK